MKKKERNFTFDLLYALAIIMVVDDHTKSQLGILIGISLSIIFAIFINKTKEKMKKYYIKGEK